MSIFGGFDAFSGGASQGYTDQSWKIRHLYEQISDLNSTIRQWQTAFEQLKHANANLKYESAIGEYKSQIENLKSLLARKAAENRDLMTKMLKKNIDRVDAEIKKNSVITKLRLRLTVGRAVRKAHIYQIFVLSKALFELDPNHPLFKKTGRKCKNNEDEVALVGLFIHVFDKELKGKVPGDPGGYRSI